MPSDPEDVAKLLNEYLGIMAKIVREWGGTIPQFTGDSIYAIFCAPDSKGEREDSLACVGDHFKFPTEDNAKIGISIMMNSKPGLLILNTPRLLVFTDI